MLQVADEKRTVAFPPSKVKHRSGMVLVKTPPEAVVLTLLPVGRSGLKSLPLDAVGEKTPIFKRNVKSKQVLHCRVHDLIAHHPVEIVVLDAMRPLFEKVVALHLTVDVRV